MQQNRNSQRRTINLPKEPQAAVNRLVDIKNSRNPSGTVVEACERFMSVVSKSMPDFTENEWCLIFDALSPPWQADEIRTSQMAGEIAEAMNSDRLDLKWNIEGARLKSRIDRASYAVRTAIGEMTEAFWRDETGDGYRAVIARLKRGFTDWERTQAPAIRKDRLSPDKMGEVSKTEKEPDQKQQTAPTGEAKTPATDEQATEAPFPDFAQASDPAPQAVVQDKSPEPATTEETEAPETEAEETETTAPETEAPDAKTTEAPPESAPEPAEETQEPVAAIEYTNDTAQPRGRLQPAGGRPGLFNRPGGR